MSVCWLHECAVQTAELTEVSFGELTQVRQGPLGVSAAVYAAK